MRTRNFSENWGIDMLRNYALDRSVQSASEKKSIEEKNMLHEISSLINQMAIHKTGTKRKKIVALQRALYILVMRPEKNQTCSNIVLRLKKCVEIFYLKKTRSCTYAYRIAKWLFKKILPTSSQETKDFRSKIFGYREF